MKPSDTATVNDRYTLFPLLFILILPLHGISFFDIGFHGSPDNIFIILVSLLICIDYLIFDDVREHINNRLFSNEAKPLLLLLGILFVYDLINVLYYGNAGYLADRMGTIMLLLLFICGISTFEHLRKVAFYWMIASSYLALQNMLSNLGITPVIEGSPFVDPRIIYGIKMPFHYAVGLPGDFGWHGMMLITGFVFSCYVYRTNKPVAIVCALLCFGSIVMMQSRTAYLGFLVALILLVFLLIDYNRRKGVIIIIFSPILICAFVWYQDIFVFFQHAWRGFVEVAEGNVNKRLLQFQLAISIGLKHPLIGAGHHSFKTVANIPYAIHNSFLYQLASLGVASFLVYSSTFLLALYVSFRNLLSRRRGVVPAINLFLFCILVGLIIELNLFLVISGRIPWLIIYFILLVNSLSKQGFPVKENAEMTS